MKNLALVMIFVMTSRAALAGLTWGAETEGLPVLNSDSSTELSLGNSATTGAFAQLIRILVGNTAYTFTGTGTGIDVVNETIADTMYAGQWNDSLPNGYFPYNTTTILNNTSFNGFYYVRVFNAPQSSQSDFDNSLIPSTATHYYQSAAFSYTHDVLSPATFDFGDNATTIAIVPEPGVLAMMGLGLFGLASVRRRMNG